MNKGKHLQLLLALAYYGSIIAESSPAIRILGLFDTENWEWGEELFTTTMQMINDPTNGWHDELSMNTSFIEYDVRNSACDGSTASKEYWAHRTENGGVPPHGLMGCRCSSSSISSARVASLEGVPQVSPASTAIDLSDRVEFPYFARTVASDIYQTKAIVSILRGFNWDRVSIILTDTVFSTGLSTSFQQLWTGKHKDASGEWKGDIAYTHSIVINPDESVNDESVRQALDRVPTDDPINNSRVILLIAHNQHAFSILKTAAKMSFQPDTIWIGVDAWANRYPADMDDFMSAFPEDVHPGYLAITPYMNKNQDYDDFIMALQVAQDQDGKEPWSELPNHAAQQLVDSILALAMALVATPPLDRRNGTAVMSNLLDLDFNGVSGRVRFTSDGDREDPQYSLFNLKRNGDTMSWEDIGSTRSVVGSAEISLKDTCFAPNACGLNVAPNDSYPIPEPAPVQLAIWIPIVLSIVALLLVGITYRYIRIYQDKKELVSSMTELEKKVKALNSIDDDLDNLNKVVDDAKARQQSLIMKRAALQGTPSTWTESSDILVPVTPEDEEYWSVLESMRATIPNAHISQLHRVQNESLWSYYSFHKDRLEGNNIESNEKRVWHGTSSLDPSVIYNDKMDGFMMQFAAQGLWGRGIYFADKASYSKNYSYTPSPKAKGDLEMFLTRLTVGKEIKLKQDRTLTVPPVDVTSGLKYNTVTGNTAGSQVWIVYENGRAYPEYLVRYYVGSRDKSRTPYASKREASKSSRWSASASFERELSKSLVDQPEVNQGLIQSQSNDRNGGVWEYQTDSGSWVAYDTANQALIEKCYQDYTKGCATSLTGYLTGYRHSSKVAIKGPEWGYEIDVQTMKQTNIQHSNRTVRDVRFSHHQV